MNRKPREEWNKNCISHCAKCDYHFSGDSAFDAHITHEGDKTFHEDPATLTYSSKSKYAGQPMLQPSEGRCDHMPGCWVDGRRVKWEEPVVIWQGVIHAAT